MEKFNHINGYHGSSKDECLYCGKFNADESKKCKERKKQELEILNSRIERFEKFIQVVSNLSENDFDALQQYLPINVWYKPELGDK